MQAFIGEVVPAGNVDFSPDLYIKIYFSGCDFRCPYCNTPDLLETKFEQEIDLREVKNEMNSYRGAKGVLFTGGEPCFQKSALIELLKKARELQMETVLDTNGSKPEVVEACIKNELVDIIIMDMKSPFTETFDKTTKSATFFKQSKDIMEDVKQTLRVLKSYDEKIEVIFRTTIVPGLMYRKEDLLEIAEEISGINCTWELKPFINDIVTDRRMQSINSPTEAFIENIKEAINKEYPDIILQ